MFQPYEKQVATDDSGKHNADDSEFSVEGDKEVAPENTEGLSPEEIEHALLYMPLEKLV